MISKVKDVEAMVRQTQKASKNEKIGREIIETFK